MLQRIEVGAEAGSEPADAFLKFPFTLFLRDSKRKSVRDDDDALHEG